MTGKMIAFSGKGGSGKTTLASLVLWQLIRTGRRPVLAVDADPNATLGLMLGVPVTGTIADIREDMGQAALKPSEIPKQRLLDQLLSGLLSEQDGFDLLTMGRPEGPKCYCYVNGLLRRYLSLLRGSYPYIVVDCEAGMEYLSRLVVEDVETLVFVAEPTNVGLATARRIAALADSLKIGARNRILALNKVAERHVPPTLTLPEVGPVVTVGLDVTLAAKCANGEPIDEQAGRNVRPAIAELTDRCLGLEPSAAGADRQERA